MFYKKTTKKLRKNKFFYKKLLTAFYIFDNIITVKKNATKKERGEKMANTYNYNKLKGRIVEKLGSIANFSKEMKSSETTIYNKLNGKIEFRQSEIVSACEILQIPEAEMMSYFFSFKS